MPYKPLVCCLIALAFALPARGASLWNPEPGFVPEDARRAVPNNPAPPERVVPEHVLPPLPATSEGTIRRVATREKVAALTFDLCELSTITTGYDADVIDFLRARRIPATLFMGGKWMRTHAGRTMQLLADPLFEIGNHAWAHGNFGIMDERNMLEQVRWTQAEYERLREKVLERAAVEGRETALRWPCWRAKGWRSSSGAWLRKRRRTTAFPASASGWRGRSVPARSSFFTPTGSPKDRRRCSGKPLRNSSAGAIAS